ncbi:MAG: siroheme synthase, partial [Fimbriimonas sp.]
MPYPQYHPVYLDLNGRSVLVVGGGAVALEKLHSLLPASGARITVVSPEARAEIRAWHEEGKLVWEARAFVPSDVEAFFMVIAATDDPGLNALVYRTGNERNKLSNSVDDPVNCNFIMSAIARQGPMQVAVSSAGCSPALAQRVRSRISNEILTEELGALAEFLGDRRDEVKRRLPGYKVRQAFWEGVIDSPIPDLLKDGKDAEGEFRRRLERAVQSASPGLKGPDDAAQNLGTGSSFQGGEVALSPGGRGAGVRGSKEVGLRFGTPWKDRFRGVSLPFPTPSAAPLTLPSPARGEGYPIDSGLGHAEIDAISTSMPTEGEGYLGPFVATSDLSAADGFKPGKVSIVGAGPGDPELLTLKAVRALQRAQVVLYDRLVSPEVLEYVPARAERIYVGKEVGHKGKGRQRWIEETMVARARAGKAVVRLKGGDPFVFGRGGEEVLALKEAGIEFEVV